MPLCNKRESGDVNKCVSFSQGGSGRPMCMYTYIPKNGRLAYLENIMVYSVKTKTASVIDFLCI